jgi:hypothetical protein
MQPKYAHKKVLLQKRKCPNCSYKTVDKDRTNAKSKYSFQVGAPGRGQWWWRLRVPASTKYIASYSGVFSTRQG